MDIDEWNRLNSIPAYIQDDPIDHEPYGIVCGDRVPLYVAGRLRLLDKAEGELIIWDKTPKMAWEFWKKCYDLMQSGTLTWQEKTHLEYTMETVEFMKPILLSKMVQWKKDYSKQKID